VTDGNQDSDISNVSLGDLSSKLDTINDELSSLITIYNNDRSCSRVTNDVLKEISSKINACISDKSIDSLSISSGRLKENLYKLADMRKDKKISGTIDGNAKMLDNISKTLSDIQLNDIAIINHKLESMSKEISDVYLMVGSVYQILSKLS
jgi:hypothetical protein